MALTFDPVTQFQYIKMKFSVNYHHYYSNDISFDWFFRGKNFLIAFSNDVIGEISEQNCILVDLK